MVFVRFYSCLLLLLSSYSLSAQSLETQEPLSPDFRSRVYNYYYWYPRAVDKYFDNIEDFSKNQISSSQFNCRGLYNRALQQGKFKITYALGYFDDSLGHPVIYDGINYGYSPSLDIEIFHILRRAFTQECDLSTQRQLCGFRETGDPLGGHLVFKRLIVMGDFPVEVEITLTHASASVDFQKNKTELAPRQRRLTQQSEANYFDQIGQADVVIYNGHSRDGGGPDFAPPILNRAMKTDYAGYYHIQRKGIRRVLQQLARQNYKNGVLAFFSCYAQRHFYGSISKAHPRQKLILSADTIDYRHSLLASVGYMEGFLRGYCGQDLERIAKHEEAIVKGFRTFNIAP